MLCRKDLVVDFFGGRDLQSSEISKRRRNVGQRPSYSTGRPTVEIVNVSPYD